MKCFPRCNGLLKNSHVLRCAYHSSLLRTEQYASFLMMSRALHLALFEQPFKNCLNALQKYNLCMLILEKR